MEPHLRLKRFLPQAGLIPETARSAGDRSYPIELPGLINVAPTCERILPTKDGDENDYDVRF